MLQSISRRVLVSFVASGAVSIVTACGGGGSSGGAPASPPATITHVGKMEGVRADPARDRIYVADGSSSRLLVVDSATGATIGELALPGEPAGIATDELGSEIYVALPARRSLAVLDATALTLTRELSLPAQPHALERLRDGVLYAASDGGLLEIQLASGGERVVLPAVHIDAFLAVASDGRRVYAAQTSGAQMEALFYEPLRLPPNSGSSVLAHSGPVAGLALTFDDRHLLVASRVDPVIELLDAGTLGLIRALDRNPAPLALAANATATRLFVASGAPDVDGLDALLFGTFRTYSAPGDLQPSGLAIDASSRHLLAHLADGTLRSVALFDAELEGDAIVQPGTDYHLAVDGEAGEGFLVYAGASAGVSFLDPNSIPGPLFLDLELASAIVIASGTLDGAGRAAIELPVDPGAAEGRFFVQAVLLGAPGAGLRAVSNPKIVHIARPGP